MHEVRRVIHDERRYVVFARRLNVLAVSLLFGVITAYTLYETFKL